MADVVIESGYRQGMRYDDIRKLLKRHFQQMLAERIEDIGQTGRLSPLDRATLDSSLMVAESAIATGGPLALLSSDHDLMVRFIEKYSLEIDTDSPAYASLNHELKRSYRDFIKAIRHYDDSLDEYTFESTDIDHKVSESKISTNVGLSIGDLAKSYEREKSVGQQWVAKTALEKLDHIELLKEILGAEFLVKKLTADETMRVKDVLARYPRNRTKNPATRGKSLEDALLVESVQKLHVTTINKYLQTYADMFEWAKRNNHLPVNLFHGLTIKQNKQKSQTKRSAFSNSDIQRILTSINSNSDNLIRKEYQKWGPIVGIYTGARLNEIAQIHLTDIRQADGIWFFDLNDDTDDKKLKIGAARRRIPIHAELIKMGLLQYVERMRADGHMKLFPDFTYCSRNGWGRSLGRWFNETFLPALKLKRRDLVFHSLRHTVVTRLQQADVPEPMVQALVGHAQIGVTQQNYFKEGYTLAQLSDALGKLNFTPVPTSAPQ